MAIIHRSKKRKIIMSIVLSTVVVVIGVTLVLICSEGRMSKVTEKNTQIANAQSSDDRENLEDGASEESFEDKLNYDATDNYKNTDSDRYIHYSCINLFSGIAVGDLVDIRICFPSGEDYIVVSHKKIINIDENGVVLKINEEELLKMSSARIDMNTYAGTYIYAVKYLSDEQKPATSYYLLNEYVLSLCEWNPNIVDKVFSQENLKKRYDFEQNLVKFQIEKEVG